MKLKHKIDYEGLQIFLSSLNRKEDIETSYNKPENPKLVEGHSMGDIERWGLDSNVPVDRVIDYGEPFLVDALGNDLSIVILSRRNYKLPNGSRCIKAKFVKTIVEDCNSIYGTPLNGYWIIPKQFIENI